MTYLKKTCSILFNRFMQLMQYSKFRLLLLGLLTYLGIILIYVLIGMDLKPSSYIALMVSLGAILLTRL